MPSLCELSSSSTVENIVVFIADSLRYDALPEAIAERGVTARTISPSTATASSIPSLMTGTYPATHCVWTFEDTLPETPILLEGENRGLKTQRIWEDLEPERRPPLRSLCLTNETTVNDVSLPSLVVIHDRGAHGPYDFRHNDFDRSDEFFETYGNRTDELKSLYYSGAEHVGEQFIDLYESLPSEETLVVFTSDHGELLGESKRGGVWGHGTPVCPELVTVPTVFLGAGLPEGKTLEQTISGVDLAPTLLSAQDRSVPDYVDGVDLWDQEADDDRVLRSDFWTPAGRVTYGASYARSDSGAVVHHFGSAPERLLYAVHRQLYVGAQAPANRSLNPRAWLGLIKSYGKEEQIYGDPDLERLRDVIPDQFERTAQDHHVEGPSEDHLKALGYIE